MRRWMNQEKYPAYFAWISGFRRSNPSAIIALDESVIAGRTYLVTALSNDGSKERPE
jgi:hypothetical protein